MPTVPKWMANAMEKLFANQFHPVKVTDMTYLDMQLKRVRFEGDLSKTKFKSGKVIEFRVGDTAFRHYTPSHFDKENGVCEVLFYLHGLGEGSEWAHSLSLGDSVKLMGPGGKMTLKENAHKHFFFGDETSLGLHLNFATTAQRLGKEWTSLLELKQEHQHWSELINLPSKVVQSSFEYPAKDAIALLENIDHSWWTTAHETIFYLSGRAKSILAFRNYLRSKGISSRNMQTYPYWAKGKRGL
ncbi:MAG: siderophore-interacting protein [Bacteroidota bacterium]